MPPLPPLRRQKSDSDTHALVIKQSTCYTTCKYQRHKHAASGKHRTQHRREYLLGSLADSLIHRKSHPTFLYDIVYHYDRVIHYHTHTQYQARQGNNIDGYMQQAKAQQGDNQRQWN